MPCCLEEFESLSNLITQRHWLLQGAFSSIDGLSLTAQESDDPEIENATYNGWKLNHCINNVLVFSPEGAYTSFNCPAITFTVVIISRCYHICRPQLARKLAWRSRRTANFWKIVDPPTRWLLPGIGYCVSSWLWIYIGKDTGTAQGWWAHYSWTCGPTTWTGYQPWTSIIPSDRWVGHVDDAGVFRMTSSSLEHCFWGTTTPTAGDMC